MSNMTIVLEKFVLQHGKIETFQKLCNCFYTLRIHFSTCLQDIENFVTKNYCFLNFQNVYHVKGGHGSSLVNVLVNPFLGIKYLDVISSCL